MSQASRRYARALFDIAKEQNSLKELTTDLSFLNDLIDSEPTIANSFNNKYFGRQNSEKLINTVNEQAKLTKLTYQFLVLLIRNRRLYLLQDIIKVFQTLCDNLQNILRGEIVTARDLPQDIKSQFENLLHEKTGKKIYLTLREDPNLLGGAVINLGNIKIDASLQTQLQKIQDILQK